MSLQNLPSASAVHKWRKLYLAALYEKDKQRLPFLIAKAEKALQVRARELLLISKHMSEEGKALDKGLYALRALRDCHALKAA